MTKKYTILESILSGMTNCWVMRTEFRCFRYFSQLPTRFVEKYYEIDIICPSISVKKVRHNFFICFLFDVLLEWVPKTRKLTARFSRKFLVFLILVKRPQLEQKWDLFCQMKSIKLPPLFALNEPHKRFLVHVIFW